MNRIRRFDFENSISIWEQGAGSTRKFAYYCAAFSAPGCSIPPSSLSLNVPFSELAERVAHGIRFASVSASIANLLTCGFGLLSERLTPILPSPIGGSGRPPLLQYTANQLWLLDKQASASLLVCSRLLSTVRKRAIGLIGLGSAQH